MAVLSPEGGDVFAVMSGRYTAHKGKQGVQSANLGVFLRGHSGDTMRVDRVGRPDEYVKQPALTVALTVQPSVLQGLRHQAEFRERGLLGRFLYALPPVLLGHRQTQITPVPAVVSQTYHTTLTTLLLLPLATDADGIPTAKSLRLTPEAATLFEDFEASVEPMLAQFGVLGHMTDWGGKCVGHVAQIMGLLHCALTPMAPWETPIAPTTVDSALKIGRYAMAHARAAIREASAGESKGLRPLLSRGAAFLTSLWASVPMPSSRRRGSEARASHLSHVMHPWWCAKVPRGAAVPRAPGTVTTGARGRRGGTKHRRWRGAADRPELDTHSPQALRRTWGTVVTDQPDAGQPLRHLSYTGRRRRV